MGADPRNPWSPQPGRDYRCIRPQCGHRWRSRGPKKPAQCPRCHNGNWEKPPTLGAEKIRLSRAKGRFRCLRCGGRWNPRDDRGPNQRPIRCQRCGTTNWWRPPYGHPEYLRRWKARKKARATG